MTYFNEDEIVAGDLIKVDLDPEVFRMMQEAIGQWDDNISQVYVCTLIKRKTSPTLVYNTADAWTECTCVCGVGTSKAFYSKCYPVL